MWVQVMEARNLALPQEMLHSFFTMDAYVVASVNTEAGVTSLQTKVIAVSLAPQHTDKGWLAVPHSGATTRIQAAFCQRVASRRGAAAEVSRPPAAGRRAAAGRSSLCWLAEELCVRRWLATR